VHTCTAIALCKRTCECLPLVLCVAVLLETVEFFKQGRAAKSSVYAYVPSIFRPMDRLHVVTKNRMARCLSLILEGFIAALIFGVRALKSLRCEE
jgi:hypothetical protein